MRLHQSGGIAHIIESAEYVAERFPAGTMPFSEIHASATSFLRKAAVHARQLIAENKSTVLERFSRRFAWIKSSYLGRAPVTLRDMVELAEESSEERTQAGYENVHDAILSRLISWHHDERKANILQSIYATEPLLACLAEKIGCSMEKLKYVLPEELSKIVEPDFQEELERRREAFVDYAQYPLKRVLFSGKVAAVCIATLQKRLTHTGPVLGTSAHRGLVRGRVRVCVSLASIRAFKEGEILVASMTRPEYIIAMKKATAFVTDEGGITCHAAIISRELKKPCIIGTKIATKVLRDGDMVEVDAERGIVTVLERTENRRKVAQTMVKEKR